MSSLPHRPNRNVVAVKGNGSVQTAENTPITEILTTKIRYFSTSIFLK